MSAAAGPWLASGAHAQWAGTWNAGATRIQVSVESWGPDCGPRPRSATVPAAGQVRITESGDHLVIHGRVQRRTDGCWSENRAVRRVSASHQEGLWRTTCRTARTDPRSETGTYTLRANGTDRLEFTDRSRYDWQLNESRCVGTITSTQVFARMGGGPRPPPDPTPDPERSRCTPGAGARVRLRPSEGEIEPGGELRLRATVVDASGCPVPRQTIRWELSRPAGLTGELQNGVFTAGETAAEAEGEFTIVAQSGSHRAEARVIVRTPDLSDLIARRTGGGVVQAQDDEDATAESAAGVSARAAETEEGSGWLWPVVGGAAALLVLLLLGLLIALRRSAGRLTPPPDRYVPAVMPSAEPTGAPAPVPAPTASPPHTSPHAGPGTKSCPVCHREYTDPAMAFCAKDGSRLVTREAAPAGGQPLICPTCRRGYAPGTLTCPADGEELMPYAAFVARHKAREAGEAALTKICPKCGDQYAKRVTYCSKDGSELVPVN